jgi:SAM-dependent methyltransferase
VAEALQHSVLEALEGAKNYNAWVASLVAPHLGDDPLEIGSGTGTYAELWLEAGVPRLTVTDLDTSLVGRLRERFAADRRVSVEELDLLEARSGDHSAVVALNVLEHIEDDVAALRQAGGLVRPGGAVVVFVPAFEFAMSRFDRAIGHFRRYTTESASQAIDAAGLVAEDIRYVNAPGLIAWTVGMRLLRMRPGEGPVLRVWDGSVVPLARRVEARWRPPFGQSVLAVARAHGHGAQADATSAPGG